MLQLPVQDTVMEGLVPNPLRSKVGMGEGRSGPQSYSASTYPTTVLAGTGQLYEQLASTHMTERASDSAVRGPGPSPFQRLPCRLLPRLTWTETLS